jgi:hypothetical protein
MTYKSFIIASCCLLLLSGVVATASAQIPKTLAYQGILADAEGILVPDGAYSITFKLYDLASGGAALWSETQSVTVLKGVFSVALGNTTALTLAFDKQYWIATKVGADPEMTPRVILTASPYALNAQKLAGIAVNTLPTANALLPLDASGQFPASVIPASPGVATSLPYLTIHTTTATNRNSLLVTQDNGNTDAVNVTAASGTGEGVQVVKQGGAGNCFQAETNGTGAAGYFTIDNTANASRTIYGYTNGTGQAAYLQVSNADNSNDALYVTTNSKGTAMTLNHTGASGNIAVFKSSSVVKASIDKNGDVQAVGNVLADGYFLSSKELGGSATPVKNALYVDNVVHVWANVSSGGTLVDGFGCTVVRNSTGTFAVTYKNGLTEAYAPVVTALEATKPQFAVISSASTSGCTVKVWQFNSTTKTFELADSQFFIHVMGRY